jgi:two-component system nitrogen regulation response regulator GlnG
MIYESPNKIIGTSKVMQDVFKQIGKLSKSDASILITGESGTGKELIAKAIHENSLRKDKPFIALNSAAIPKDLA